ncbi:MAG: hypothetical protein ACI9DJ_003514, partial [Algoriphagus sp.]
MKKLANNEEYGSIYFDIYLPKVYQIVTYSNKKYPRKTA